jgi:hypothetical protein
MLSGFLFVGGHEVRSLEKEKVLSASQTENLIVAILIGNSKVICKSSGLHELEFILPTNRQHIFKTIFE